MSRVLSSTAPRAHGAGRVPWLAALLAVVLCVCIRPGLAQEAAGELSGSVRDEGGSPLPGVTLVLRGSELGEPLAVVTDDDGRYAFGPLPAGTFDLTCDAPGFEPWTREGLAIEPGATVVVDVTMRSFAMASPGDDPEPREEEPPDPAVSPGQPGTGPPAHRLLEEIESYLAQLDIGSIAFNAPERLRVGETTEIRLLLSPTTTVEELERQLADLPGVPQGAEIRVAPLMEAVLTGQNFQISAITPQRQAVARDEETVWRWEVSARTPGDHRLHLAVNAMILDSARSLRTFDQVIFVQVTWPQRVATFVGENWQWLWTAAVIPLAGWWWRRRSRPSGPERPQPQGGGSG